MKVERERERKRPLYILVLPVEPVLTKQNTSSELKNRKGRNQEEEIT